MVDPGFVPGLIGVSLQMTIDQIFRQINIARRCGKELSALKDKIIRIEPIIEQIQQCRLELNQHKNEASTVNTWLKELQVLLKEASEIVHQCTIPTLDLVSKYKTAKKITHLMANIDKYLSLSHLVQMVQTQEQTRKILEGQKQIKETMRGLVSSGSSASTSQAAPAPEGTSRTKLMDEPLVVGEEKALASMEKWVTDDAEANNIGVLGMGGSGKTLLLKRLFNSEKVSNHFSHGFLLWLTVSQSRAVRSLRDELYAQIASQKNVVLEKNMDEDVVKIWLNETLQQSSRFALFIDDVWEKVATELLEGLGILRAVTDHSNSKIIVSSRYRSVLLKMGVAEKYTITMENLSKDQSWKLFSYHAFPYNNRSIPPNINEENAKLVCHRCGGLPLALKIVGRAMAGCIDPEQWKWAAQRLPNADSFDACLRLSYDALGKENINLQLCFLYMAAAFGEDKIIHANHVIPLWVGEGLLARKDAHPLGYSPFSVGRVYLNLLADRCLIEPIVRSIEGFVVFFRIHSLLCDLAIRIAEAEETFFCRVGQGLNTLNENECSGCTRILLSSNQLCSLPESMRVPELCSLFIDRNKRLTKIPKGVVGSMASLKVLDLSGTSVQSLPESVGCLKQLRCLFLSSMPINLLPASLTNLGNLEILDLSRSSIKELPSGLHNLKSLRHLAMDKCGHLQYLPLSITQLTSLQGLTMYGCTNLWENGEPNKWKKVATISRLGSLKQLTRFHLTNNGDVIREGTLGNMIEMNTLMLKLTKMRSLPNDITNMSKLRRLYMECPDLVKMESNFCAFQSMTSLILYKCEMLEELSHLHKLNKLERLEIIECPRLKKFPQEFGDKEAFSLLKIFSIVGLHELEELPILQEGAMPLLQTFILVECSALKEFPKSYSDLKTLQTIKIYGCSSMIMENLREIQESNRMIEVKTMPVEDTRESRKRYSELMAEMKSWLYGEFWSNDVFLFLRSLYTVA